MQHVGNKYFERKWEQQYPQIRIAVELKIVDSFDTFQTFYVLQLVVAEIYYVDCCDTFQTIYVLQLVVAEIKNVDSGDSFEAVHIFQ